MSLRRLHVASQQVTCTIQHQLGFQLAAAQHLCWTMPSWLLAFLSPAAAAVAAAVQAAVQATATKQAATVAAVEAAITMTSACQALALRACLHGMLILWNITCCSCCSCQASRQTAAAILGTTSCSSSNSRQASCAVQACRGSCSTRSFR